ncbi:fatty acid-binding protein 2, liver-like [Branchiostoma floridae]|uniref:Fatty acid-binding protein 2, liver-like n=1 Tax=Branchiostoma floridae TaxID=7739 RepID=A0A9J7KM20_BRAFL|nr:fatty acid-binding protein 2, liver-like [Branchiostoma floridae]
MPFDIGKTNGTWKVNRTSDNYIQLLGKLGVPEDIAKKSLDAEYPLQMTVSGDSFSSKMEVMGKTVENSYTLGVEGMEQDALGKTRKVTYTQEGDCLVSVYPDYDGMGLVFRHSRRFLDDNTLHLDMTVGDLEGWSESKRC